MKVIVVGVPGAGKTSVAKGLCSYGWTLATFGTYMFEIAKEKFGITHRDHMRTEISGENYKKIQELAAKKMGSLKGNVVIDTHLSIKKPEGYYPGLPTNVLKKLQPDILIVVEADSKAIDKRRTKDASERIRKGNVKEHQEINRYYAAVCSMLQKIPILIIDNKEGKLKETVAKIASTLSKVQSNG